MERGGVEWREAVRECVQMIFGRSLCKLYDVVIGPNGWNIMHCHQVIFEYILLLCLPISIEKWPRIHRTLRTMLDFTDSRWCTFEEPQNYKNSITFFSWKIRKVIMFLHFASNLCKVFALASYYFNNATALSLSLYALALCSFLFFFSSLAYNSLWFSFLISQFQRTNE